MYSVLIDGERGGYALATQRVFGRYADADRYADTVARGLHPFVAAEISSAAAYLLMTSYEKAHNLITMEACIYNDVILLGDHTLVTIGDKCYIREDADAVRYSMENEEEALASILE